MVAVARWTADVGQPLVDAVADEIRAAALEERIRNEVRRELGSRYRVASEDETPDTEEGDEAAAERRRQTR
jgi:hypothetical protein